MSAGAPSRSGPAHGPRRRRRKGFSLLEVLVAIALAAALLWAMFGFFWNLSGTRGQILAETARRRAATVLIEGIERDLMTAVVGDAIDGAGVAGDAASLGILSRGVPVRLAGGQGRAGEGLGDLERSEYRFDAGSEALLARRSPAGPRASAGAEFFALEGKIHRVRFRYRDGGRWREDFDSLREAHLPRAIEVAIWFDPPPGEAPVPPAGVEDVFVPARRATFDAAAGFDERQFAMESDPAAMGEPPPDRLRVIAIPDAGPDAGSGEEPEVAR